MVAPILIALLLAIVQAGVAFNHYLAVTDAARAAARQAIEARIAGVTVSDIQAAAQSAAGGLDLTNRVRSPTRPTRPSRTPAARSRSRSSTRTRSTSSGGRSRPGTSRAP